MMKRFPFVLRLSEKKSYSKTVQIIVYKIRISKFYITYVRKLKYLISFVNSNNIRYWQWFSFIIVDLDKKEGWVNKMYTAKVIALNKNIEEEAIISINNVEFTTFISYIPYNIEIGEEYPVDITLFGDILEIRENIDKKIEITRVNETFRYIIQGYLFENGQLDIGFIIEDNELFWDYPYLYGKYVIFTVDRINSEFL